MQPTQRETTTKQPLRPGKHHVRQIDRLIGLPDRPVQGIQTSSPPPAPAPEGAGQANTDLPPPCQQPIALSPPPRRRLHAPSAQPTAPDQKPEAETGNEATRAKQTARREWALADLALPGEVLDSEV